VIGFAIMDISIRGAALFDILGRSDRERRVRTAE